MTKMSKNANVELRRSTRVSRPVQHYTPVPPPVKVQRPNEPIYMKNGIPLGKKLPMKLRKGEQPGTPPPPKVKKPFNVVDANSVYRGNRNSSTASPSASTPTPSEVEQCGTSPSTVVDQTATVPHSLLQKDDGVKTQKPSATSSTSDATPNTSVASVPSSPASSSPTPPKKPRLMNNATEPAVDNADNV